MAQRIQVAVLAVWSLCASALGQELLLEARGRDAIVKSVIPDTAMRTRNVVLNESVLPTTTTRTGAKLRLSLFADRAVDVALETLTSRSANRYTWTGKLTDDEYSRVTISVVDGILQANVHSPAHGWFQIRYGAGDTYQVSEIDPTEFAACATGADQAVIPTPTPALLGQPRPLVTRGAGDVADILVVYTKSARATVGGTAAMESLIDLAIAESNDAYSFSLIDFALNLVGTFEVGYVESAGFSAALGALRTNGDGVMDEVHIARESTGADFVDLIINDGSSCGIGYLMLSETGDFSGSAFSVVHYGCATGNFSFAHELGHNMGAQHDLTQAPGGGLFPDSLGWHWGNSSVPGVDGDYRSIMAYAPGVRVQRFSNPSVSYAGEPTGLINVANNAFTLNITAPIAAGWRAPAAWITALPNDGVNTIGDEGGPFSPSALTFTLTNLDNTPANWSASSNQAWATVSPTSGNLAMGASTTVTVTFGAAANALPGGLHTAAVTFTDLTNGRISAYNVRLLSVVQPSQTVQHYVPMNSNPGWTPTALWQFGVPLGAGSRNPDPTSGFTGSNVYGYNLAGDYPDNMIERTLTTTAFNCSGLTKVGLTFQRWLGVEDSAFDHAKVQVSNNGTTWTDVWVHNGPAIAESEWSKQSYDISAVANGRSTVYVRWVMGTADSSVTYSGWNIDDVAILGDPVTPVMLNDVWVDISHPGVERGTQMQPYSSLEEGIAHLNPGGTLHIVSAIDVTRITFSKPMTVIAEGGPVVVGAF